MKSQLAQDTTKSAKSLAQQIAKQIAREPIEILKEAKEQTTGEETSNLPGKPVPEHTETQQKKIEEQKQIQDKMKSSRLYDAFKRELDDIRKQDVFSDLQKRISEGEEIPLEDYPELSMEQKQVLKAEMEAIRMQKKVQTETVQEVPAVHSKPSRRFGAGQKQEAEREQTRVEKPVPPSG